MPDRLSDDTEAESLLAALKEMLKSRRIGYRAIAEALAVSLPTVKRMLNKTRMPLDRFLSICRLADVEPSEVLALADRRRPKHHVFSAEQAAFLDRAGLGD